jgi:hypothetical protein
MPLSNDNQDYKNPENKNEQNQQGGKEQNSQQDSKNKLNSDDLKGKKVDADPAEQKGKPADI